MNDEDIFQCYQIVVLWTIKEYCWKLYVGWFQKVDSKIVNRTSEHRSQKLVKELLIGHGTGDTHPVLLLVGTFSMLIHGQWA